MGTVWVNSVAPTGPATPTVAVSWSSIDGSLNAPTGISPQRPTLFSGFAARPPWKVAGVDYGVGYPSSWIGNLTIPSGTVGTQGNLPAGCTIFPANTVRIDSTSVANVTLNGFDFTGWTITVLPTITGTITITNCLVAGVGNAILANQGSSGNPYPATTNFVIKNCILDGQQSDGSNSFALITSFIPCVAWYNYIHDGAQGIHIISQPGDVRYNLIEKMAWTIGDHANCIYISSPSSQQTTVFYTIQFNTGWSGASQSSGVPIGVGSALNLTDETPNTGQGFSGSNVSYNSIVASFPGSGDYLFGYRVTAPDFAVGGTVNQNYFYSFSGFNSASLSSNGAFGAFYQGSTGTISATYSSNVDMFTGKIVNSDNTET